MTWIHEKPRWPTFTWDAHVLADALAGVRHRQGHLLGRMEALGFDLQAQAKLAVLTSDVVTSSAIEGEKLNADEVRSSVARRLGLDTAGLPMAGRDVEGVVEMMTDGTLHFDKPLTSKRLFAWHALLFPTGRSGMKRIKVGAWRTKQAGVMQIVSGPIGREKVHFEAPRSERMHAEMSRFIKWFNSPPIVDPVLQAGIAHFWFVTIHPFEAERKDYYLQLEKAQRGDVNITPWLAWFLGCLDRAITGADVTLAAVLNKARMWERINQRPINERQRLAINRMLDGFKGFLSSSKYAKLAKCSQDTALRDIRELLDRNILLPNPGGGRSTSYRLGEPQGITD